MAQGFVNQFGNTYTYSGTGLVIPLQQSPTINQPNLVGVTDASNAAAGSVGEVISSTILAASAVSLTAGVAFNLTSISLSAGDWNIFSNIQYIGNTGCLITYAIAAVNTVSATLPDQAYWGMCGPNTLSGSTSIGANAGFTRANITTTTTYYIIGNAGFSGATLGAAGGIYARRVR